ncbi:MAG: putative Fe-S-cluster redox enzyme [Edafosvirus sp.]|uniref:Putative Fe-S-cluster redox enzyme n=1 Tax=Edafosvirus sp. TaxID=2487765 RepID=A0A3G4ZYY6_9VIRU|nr:MAG: putative Fe-S-cluster redox enzyme [Edafosvirus sp.]
MIRITKSLPFRSLNSIFARKHSTAVKKLISKDGSINWIIPHSSSNLECRYVRRRPDYISTYVSSHNGCKMGCKFCWLTQQNQTNFNHASIADYSHQLNTVLSGVPKLKDPYILNKDIRININFMARGEALANKSVINNYPQLYDQLLTDVKNHGYDNMKINISTIMPKIIENRKLINIFQDKPVNIYYSLYSTDDKFKKHWMPNAIHWKKSLDLLEDFQTSSKLNPVITFHWAFIKDQNDNLDSVQKLADEIKSRKFTRTKFNLVRFNPHPSIPNTEPDMAKLQELFNVMQSAMTDITPYNKSRIITRVGPDVYASCGMFAQDDNL